ncbi:flagellar type III secretion system protein FliR [Rhodobacteraceae bacterium RKSG542]|uniref:flagellar biosynthetic protein FliR n=1 Tax=Pseudovibrio flavus TaxID=2529854 RepID=UPI0012BCA341|nr:flagellar biosynthetic protein FliR [Pseudovibrio flavus]MTI19285.1 flagellar type III secretion system protein FliR [Pseudovibrio flavus]
MEFDLSPLTNITVVFLLIFARIGTMLMLMPGLGERAIPARMRLSMALMLAYILLPIARPYYPSEVASDFSLLITYLSIELIIGFFIGLITRLITYTLNTVGTVIANQSGLAFAMGGDMTNSGQQGAMLSNFLALLGATLIFANNLHYLVIAAMHDSFTLFPPGGTIPVADASQLAVQVVSESFSIALRMSAPFILFGLVFYFGLGLLNKLMPQLQIFFVAMPLNIMMGLVLLVLLLSTLMGWYLTKFQELFAPFLVG